MANKFYGNVFNFIQKLANDSGIEIHQVSPGRILLYSSKTGKVVLDMKKIIYPSATQFEALKPEEEQGVRSVFYLWEDIWTFRREKAESKLKSLFGLSQRIHGRQCLVRAITNDILIDFLSKNHLNVPIPAKFKYGLFYLGDLVAIMSFSKSRPINRSGSVYHSFELLRFCNKLNTTVVGGFSKLLRHFIKNVKPDDIMTYVDRDWSDGSLYEKMGFVLEDMTGPIEFRLNTENGERIYPDRLPKSMRIPGTDTETRELPKVYSMGSYKYLLLVKKANSIYQ